MKLLQNKNIAAAIMVILILISVPIGAGRSLRRLTGQAQDLFFGGVSGDGIGVYYDMEKNHAIGANLLVIAGRYIDAGDAAYTALSAAQAQFESADSLSDYATWHGVLTEAAYEMHDLLNTLSLSEQDRAYNIQLISNMEENNSRIARDAYNTLAIRIGATMDRFPARVLHTLTGVQKPPVFQR